MKISRRKFLKTMGMGVVASGLGSAAQATPGHARYGAAMASMPMPRMLEANFSMRLQTRDPTDPLAARTVQIAENNERYSFASRQTLMDVLFTDPYLYHKQTFIKYQPKKLQANFAEIQTMK
jgi:hypothetical protein